MEVIMEIGKLQGIIADKNQRLEREALGDAEDIIETIAAKQDVIAKAQSEIEILRQRLVNLEIKQLDSETLLGQ